MNNASPPDGVNGTNPGDDHADSLAETILDDPEPWEGWETRLCLYSLGLGLAALVVLGVIVNLTILS